MNPGRTLSGHRRRSYRRRGRGNLLAARRCRDGSWKVRNGPKWGVIAAAAVLLALAGAGVHWLRGHVQLAWNETDSLPQALFLVRLGELPAKGDYVLFDPPAAVGSRHAFIKRVAGVAGDRVAVEDRTVTVGGVTIGAAKTLSRNGAPLDPIAPVAIPPGFYFVHADHGDSYDSRYQNIGLVPDSRILGRAVPLF
ncbi:MAG: type VI secretion protein [Alphaproteobacteria bacterium]|nr:type VI secretion protein [Alphaproteobacteria bacterium]